jgi:hypothetical protein
MLQPENQNKKYEHLFTDIDTGRIKVPMFQRDFVWTNEQTAKLIDSIIKGFPIGSFIFWQTRDGLRHIKNIGNVSLPDVPRGEPALYVLDGQQRITSLYAVKKGARVTRDGEEIDYKRIFIDLSCQPDADDSVVFADETPKNSYISVFDLLNATAAELAQRFASTELLNRVDTYQKRLTTYDFSTVVIRDYPIETACEVFTRINTGGTELTLFEIMVAKTYDEAKKFDLLREYERLLDSKGEEKDLEDVGYDTVSDITMLQCIAAHLNKQVRAKDILKLDRDAVIKCWPSVKDSIFSVVDYLRTELRVPVSRLLPYDALLVPLSYFFVRKQGRQPSGFENALLKQYFWWAALSNRFSSAAETKIAQDVVRMDEILAGRVPSYVGEELRLTMEDLRWHGFRSNEAFCKAILCLYAHYQPKRFNTDAPVVLDNRWLRLATSKNYHHFFPKAYLAKQGVDEDHANSVLNITLVDDYLNKREIGAKAPSTYIGKFKKSNKNIADTMKTHLIEDLDQFGVWNDDYFAFIEKRGERVLAEIQRRLSPAEVAAGAKATD